MADKLFELVSCIALIISLTEFFCSYSALLNGLEIGLMYRASSSSMSEKHWARCKVAILTVGKISVHFSPIHRYAFPWRETVSPFQKQLWNGCRKTVFSYRKNFVDRLMTTPGHFHAYGDILWSTSLNYKIITEHFQTLTLWQLMGTGQTVRFGQ